MAWSLTMDSAQGLVSSLKGDGLQKQQSLRRSRPRQAEQEDAGLEFDLDLDLDLDELVDDVSSSSIPPEKKKQRLTAEQVKFLEASFSSDIKLEPDRKALIASQLGLRPRQVAIWFQNRRVRWKNKQLERDYDLLKERYEDLKRENAAAAREKESVAAENRNLQAKVAHLTSLLEESKKISDDEDKVISLPGFDSDSESGCKEDLTSPAKSSEDLSDIRDSGQSGSGPHHRDAGMVVVDPEEEFGPELDPILFVEEYAMYPLFFLQHVTNPDDPFSISCWEAMNNHLGFYGVEDL